MKQYEIKDLKIGETDLEIWGTFHKGESGSQMIEDCKTLEELMDLQTKYPDWDSSLYTDKKQKLIQVAK